MAGTNEFAFFRCKSICTGGGPESRPKKNSKKCLPAGTGTKIYFCREGKRTPTPKISIWTTPGRFTTRPLPVDFATKMSVVRPFSVLSKDEIGP